MVTINSSDQRARLIRIFTFLGGIYFFLYFVLPESAISFIGVKDRHEAISNGFIVIGAMAIGLGLFNLVSAHGTRIVFKKIGWVYSLALITGLVCMLGVTSAQWLQSLALSAEQQRSQIISEFAQRIIDDTDNTTATLTVPALQVRVDALKLYGFEHLSVLETKLLGQRGASSLLQHELQKNIATVREKLAQLDAVSWGELSPGSATLLKEVVTSGAKFSVARGAYLREAAATTTVQQLYTLLYEGFFNQLGSAMFALLGVYIAAAAYRAFRIRSVESALMMAAALIVMLGQISFGRMISDDMPALRQWLLEVPNSAAFRAIRLGAGVAGLMLAIRMWLSIESRSFSAGKKR